MRHHPLASLPRLPGECNFAKSCINVICQECPELTESSQLTFLFELSMQATTLASLATIACPFPFFVKKNLRLQVYW